MKVNYGFRLSVLGIKYFSFFHAGNYQLMKLINRFSSPVYKVKYKGQVLRAVYSNFNEAFRIARWLVKEPGTITWIESFPENSVFFDVGANVGLFSIFAAKIRGAQVYSFEPFWGNFFHLKENIELNGVTHKVTPFNLGLSDHNSFLSLRLEDTESGSSGGQVGRDLNYIGQKMTVKQDQPCPCYTLDYLVKNYIKKVPTYLKVDVDGIEPQILQGASETLASPDLKEIMVELTQVEETQAEFDSTLMLLESKGFKLFSKQKAGSDTRILNYLFKR